MNLKQLYPEEFRRIRGGINRLAQDIEDLKTDKTLALNALKDILADHKERMQLYPEQNSQANRVRVMKVAEQVINQLDTKIIKPVEKKREKMTRKLFFTLLIMAVVVPWIESFYVVRPSLFTQPFIESQGVLLSCTLGIIFVVYVTILRILMPLVK